MYLFYNLAIHQSCSVLRNSISGPLGIYRHLQLSKVALLTAQSLIDSFDCKLIHTTTLNDTNIQFECANYSDGSLGCDLRRLL